MGKIPIITQEQEIILAGIRKNDFLQENFYFTGGTALSSFYLKHRYSEDLDFFSFRRFDFKPVADFLRTSGKLYKFTFRSQTVGFAHFCILKFPGNRTLKVDFATYPYKQLNQPEIIHALKIDSMLDIAVNKLSLLSQRIEIKDYVDLYYLLKKFSLWDLIEGVRIKFNMEINPFILASDFTKAEDFDNLPKMVKPLSLDSLKEFYRKYAAALGKKSVTK